MVKVAVEGHGLISFELLVFLFTQKLKYMSVNKAILIGNVGKDPEIRYLEGGTAVANFSLATTEFYKSRDGESTSSTEWHNIVAWRQLAELADKYIRKGRQIYVEGRITTRQWEDKDGNKRYTTEIVANTIQLLGSKPEGTESRPSAPAARTETASAKPAVEEDYKAVEEDDLPF